MVKSKMVLRWWFVVSALCLISCTGTEEYKKKYFNPEELSPEASSLWVDSVYDQLTDVDKLAQLIHLEIPVLRFDMLKQIQNFPVGSIKTAVNTPNLLQFHQNKYNGLKPRITIKNWNFPIAQFHEHWSPVSFAYITDTLLMRQLSGKLAECYKDLQISAITLPFDTSEIWKKTDSSWQLRPFFNYLRAEIKKVNLDFFSDTITGYKNGQSLDTIALAHRLKNAENIFISVNSVESLDSVITYIKAISKNILINKKISEAIKDELLRKVPIKTEKRNFWKKHLVALRKYAYLVKAAEITLITNKSIIPVNFTTNFPIKVISVGTSHPEFINALRNYNRVSTFTGTTALNYDTAYRYNPIILELNEDLTAQPEIVKNILKLAEKQVVVVANFYGKSNLPLLAMLPAVVHCPVYEKERIHITAEVIFGGMNVSGAIIPSPFPAYSPIVSRKCRLSFGIPELSDVHRDSIPIIANMVHWHITAGVTPGCQLFAAKNGNVIVNSSYGYHTYDKLLPVQNNDIYDIASVTKIVATTLLGMHLYEKNKYKIFDSLRLHLPDTLRKRLGHLPRLWHTTFHELFTHTSGLPEGLSIYKYIAYVDSLIGRFDKYYCNESNHNFCVEVAKDFYMDSAYLDSLWLHMYRIWPAEKTYKYSDANMNVLYDIFQRMIRSKKTYDQYLDSVFYDRLNLKGTCFQPFQNIDTGKVRIAPTEFDTYWRYQLLKGHVHDPNAALYGGVAGNAGLFSNAYEIGVIMEMLRNKGKYGNVQFLTPQTVDRFTAHQTGSHRGLGFDKPTASSGNTVAKDCPYTAFGHTGFTGICTWVDSENDFTFVFVSNRVHPDPNNKKIIQMGTRSSLHQFFYKQFKYNGVYKNSTIKKVSLPQKTTANDSIKRSPIAQK